MGGIAVESRGISAGKRSHIYTTWLQLPYKGALKLIWWFCSAVLVVVGECGKVDGVWWYVCGKKFRKNFRFES